MPGVVANAFRQTISGYLVRDVFSTKREEIMMVPTDGKFFFNDVLKASPVSGNIALQTER